jgi:hypothetical protein
MWVSTCALALDHESAPTLGAFKVIILHDVHSERDQQLDHIRTVTIPCLINSSSQRQSLDIVGFGSVHELSTSGQSTVSIQMYTTNSQRVPGGCEILPEALTSVHA